MFTSIVSFDLDDCELLDCLWNLFVKLWLKSLEDVLNLIVGALWFSGRGKCVLHSVDVGEIV